MDHRVAGEFEAVAAYAETLQKSVELIESDRERMRSGYQLIFAVDFAEIRHFLLPESALPGDAGIASVPGEPPEQGLVRQQLALSYIFGELGHDLLILPPHQIEMSDHFHMRRSLYAKHGTADPHCIEERLARNLTEHKSFRAIAGMLERDPACESLTATQLRKVAQYVREHFMELFYLVGPSRAGRAGINEPVRHILKRYGIRPYADYFGYSELQFDTVFDASAGWFDRLKDASDPQRESAAYTDSLACAYLERTNAVINPGKEALLFITSSRSLAAALGESELIGGEPAAPRSSVVRDLNYFAALLQHHRRDPQEMDEALCRTGRHVEKIRRVLRAAALQRTDELSPSFEKAASAALGSIMRELSAGESLGLAIAAQAVPPGEEGGGAVANLSPRLSSGLRSILRLATSHRDVLGRLRDEHARSNAELGEHISDLDLLVNARWRSAERVEDVRTSSSPDGSRIVLEYFGPEMPLELSLYNPQVQRIASALLAQSCERGSDRAWHAMILDLAGIRERDPELHTLRAYLFATAGNCASALSEVQLTANDRNVRSNIRIELLYMATVLHRVQEQTEEGLISCMQGLKVDPSDPRLHHELSILLSQVLQIARPSERERLAGLVKDLAGREPDYAMALDHAGRAFGALERCALPGEPAARVPLFAHVLNCCAFLALEIYRIRRDVSYLILAEQRMAGLSALLPEKKWVRKFFHTMGCVLYERWDLSREHIDELRAAKQYLKESVGDLAVPATEKSVYEKDLEQISAQLRNLGYSDHGEPHPALGEFAR